MESETQLVNAPVMPLARDADPLAVLVPAEAIVNEEEKNSSKTSATDSKTTIVASDPEEELRKLCDEADTKAIELLGPYHALQIRISGELFPILLRIKNLLPHGEWGLWYGNFCTRHHITTSLRTVQRAFADLTDNRLLTDGTVVDDPDSGNGRCSGGNSSRKQTNPVVRGRTVKTPEQIAAEKEYIDTIAQLKPAADGGNEQAKAIIADAKTRMDAANNAAVAARGTAIVKEKPSAETRVNKRLASIVEIAERYIRVMERVVHTAPQTDRQKKDLEKARESWRKVLQDARTLSWAVQVFEKQGEEEEAA